MYTTVFLCCPQKGVPLLSDPRPFLPSVVFPCVFRFFSGQDPKDFTKRQADNFSQVPAKGSAKKNGHGTRMTHGWPSAFFHGPIDLNGSVNRFSRTRIGQVIFF